MERRQVRLEDGRYLIYFTFPAGGPAKKDDPAAADPKPDAPRPEVKRV